MLISGASRGIGLGIARRLAADGFRCIALARKTSDELEAAVQEAHAGAGEIVFRACDLSETGRIGERVRELKGEFGAFYGLVNNAGTSTEGALVNVSESAIESMIRLNTLAPILLAKYACKSMMAQGEGRIVNMASIIAATGFNGVAVYGATKASMVGFTRSLARELGRVGITVNAVAPGFIDTEMTRGMSDEDMARVRKRSPMNRLAEVGDVAAAVAYLMGPGGRNITGTVLTVDAGSTA